MFISQYLESDWSHHNYIRWYTLAIYIYMLHIGICYIYIYIYTYKQYYHHYYIILSQFKIHPPESSSTYISILPIRKRWENSPSEFGQ